MRTRQIARLALALALFGAGRMASAQVESNTSWWVTVRAGLDENAASSYKDYLEGLGFLPVALQPTGDGVDVIYGNFATHAEALRQRQNFERTGFEELGDILMIERGSGAAGAERAAGLRPVFKIEVGVFYDARQAEALRQLLEESGQLHVATHAAAGVVRVTAGEYNDRTNARALQQFLRENGYPAAMVIETYDTPSGATRAVGGRQPLGPRPAPALPPQPGPLTQDDPVTILPPELWGSLTADQKAKVLEYVSMRREIGAGNVVAEKVLQIDQRVEEMEGLVREVVARYNEEVEKRAQDRTVIAQLLREHDNLVAAGHFEDALLKIQEVLRRDKDNQVAIRRKESLQSLISDGVHYMGQKQENDRKYEELRQQAEEDENTGTIDGLSRAQVLWVQIKALGPSYADEADTRISSLERGISEMQINLKAQSDAEKKKSDLMRNILFGLIGLLGVMLAVMMVRTRAREKQIFKKLHEITQIRPMREFEPAAAGAAGQLPAGAAMAAGGVAEAEDAFGFGGGGDASAGDPIAGDPLGGVADETSDEPEPFGEVPEAEAAPEAGADDSLFGDTSMGDDPFGQAPATETADGGVDDIFGDVGTGGVDDSMTGQTGTGETSSFDDVFGDLPSMDDEGGPSLEGKDGTETTKAVSAGASADDPLQMDDIFGADPSPSEAAPSAAAGSSEASGGAISMDDILGMGGGESEAPPEASASGSEGLSIFDETDSPPEPEPPKKKADDTGDPFAGTPFADILGEEAPSTEAPGQAFAEPDDKTRTSDDLPQVGDEDPLAALNVKTPSDDPFTAAGASAGLGVAATADPDAPAGIVYQDTFNDMEAGAPPAGWKGDFPYATLQIRDDSPPKGARKYLAYVKTAQGEGKVYYRARFAKTSGILNVEFDLRCNQKNKFLLGFYIEKDEDFQQSVHTKILLSEAQTAPTILLHGEPAPYLLGSWAHIKYVIDLGKGKIDGYIDGTHIARGLQMPQRPKFLDTLAIRDSVNTTGELFIGNLVVTKVG